MAKNSEVYKTAQERVKAFGMYCKSMHEKPGGSCGKQERCSVCSLKWLDLEAEDESFESIAKDIRERIMCREPSSSLLPLFDRLVAAHNRVANAAKESEAAE